MYPYLPRPPPWREPPDGEPKPPPLEVELPPMREDVEERLVLRLEEPFMLLVPLRWERSVVVLRLTVRSDVRLEERLVTLFDERLVVPFVERSVTRLLRSVLRWFIRVARSVARCDVRVPVMFLLVELS